MPHDRAHSVSKILSQPQLEKNVSHELFPFRFTFCGFNNSTNLFISIPCAFHKCVFANNRTGGILSLFTASHLLFSECDVQQTSFSVEAKSLLTTVIIRSCVFLSSTRAHNFVASTKAILKIFDSKFVLNHTMIKGMFRLKNTKEDLSGFPHQLTVEDSLIDARYVHAVDLMKSSSEQEHLLLANLTLVCLTKVAFDKIEGESNIRCTPYCLKDQYVRKDTKHPEIAELTMVNSIMVAQSRSSPCQECPFGVRCHFPNVSALPNYWGYFSKGGIHMIRCPNNYCCSTIEECKSVDSCAGNRSGILCGTCEENMTESLFGQNCVPSETCHTTLVLLIYLLAACCYAFFILSFKTVKNYLWEKTALKEKLKLCVKNCKQRSRQATISHLHASAASVMRATLQRAQVTQKTDSGTEAPKSCLRARRRRLQKRKWKSLEDVSSLCKKASADPRPDKTEKQEDTTEKSVDATAEEDKDNSVKLIQIILYYVQDSGLLKVHIPGTVYEQDNIVRKVLEFSPDLLEMYSMFQNVCYASLTAVGKTLLMSLFGPTIMFLLFIIFLLQWLLSNCVKNVSNHSEHLQSKLCEAFLLTVLFGYQKIVKGAFSLVDCISVGQGQALYIQGEIQCFTWWQYAVQCYIFLVVGPFFVFLAIGPFYVRDKKLSPFLFVMSCVCPLPALVFFAVEKIVRKQSFVQTKNANGQESCEDPEKNLPEDREMNSSEIIVETLLKHYKTLKLGSCSYTWLGILKVYRMSLIACHTYITEPLVRLCCMAVFVLCITVATPIVRPYKKESLNIIAFLSHVATIVVCFINIVKAAFIAADFKVNALVEKVLQGCDVLEPVLLNWILVFAVVCWMLSPIWNIVFSKVQQSEKFTALKKTLKRRD